MAKSTKSNSFSKAVINVDDDTITEYLKDDDVRTYSLSGLLKDWNGVEGISITIKKDTEIPFKD